MRSRKKVVEGEGLLLMQPSPPTIVISCPIDDPMTHLLVSPPFFSNLDWSQICFNQQETIEVAQGYFQTYILRRPGKFHFCNFGSLELPHMESGEIMQRSHKAIWREKISIILQPSKSQTTAEQGSDPKQTSRRTGQAISALTVESRANRMIVVLSHYSSQWILSQCSSMGQ